MSLMAQENIQSLNFLLSCSKVLKEGELFDEDVLEKSGIIFRNSISSTPSDSDTSRPFLNEDIIAGGVAVLIVLGKTWLEKNPEKKRWCIDKVFKFVANPPHHGIDMTLRRM